MKWGFILLLRGNNGTFFLSPRQPDLLNILTTAHNTFLLHVTRLFLRPRLNEAAAALNVRLHSVWRNKSVVSETWCDDKQVRWTLFFSVRFKTFQLLLGGPSSGSTPGSPPSKGRRPDQMSRTTLIEQQAAGFKTKTISWQMLKCSADLRGNWRVGW